MRGSVWRGGNTLLKALPVEFRLLFQFSDFTFLLLPHTHTQTYTAKFMHVCLCACVCLCECVHVCSVIAAIIDFKPRTIHVNCSSRIRFHNWRLPSGVRSKSEGKVWPVCRGVGVAGEEWIEHKVLAFARLQSGSGLESIRIAEESLHIALTATCKVGGAQWGQRGRGEGACQWRQLLHCSVGRPV